MSQARKKMQSHYSIKMSSHFKAKIQGRSKAFPVEMRFWVIFLHKLVLKQLIICIVRGERVARP